MGGPLSSAKQGARWFTLGIVVNKLVPTISSGKLLTWDADLGDTAAQHEAESLQSPHRGTSLVAEAVG